MTRRKAAGHKSHGRPERHKPPVLHEHGMRFRFREVVRSLGPGLITGASDDDPSGIGTYSQAGAQLGYGIGWTMLLTFPLMAAVQEISARMGRVTGHGIAGNVGNHYAPILLNTVVALLFMANTINIAADLAAMADATRLLVGGSHAFPYVVVFGVISVAAQIFFDYRRYVAVLKWLTLSLFSYVGALAVVHISWSQALEGVLIPRIGWNAGYFTTIVAILGTTISPYLFFWQASQEVEDQRIDSRKHPLIERHYGARREFFRIRADTIVGMAFSNLIALSIIVTAAATLHAAGKTDIETSAQAAEALRPIAGAFAEAIFALGIVGTGLLAIPVLAGSAAYAVAEMAGHPASLDSRPLKARLFYGTIAATTLAGALLQSIGVNPVRALYWSAVINGVLAAPLMALMMLIVTNPRAMGHLTLGRRGAVLGWAATAIMAAATLLFFVSLF